VKPTEANNKEVFVFRLCQFELHQLVENLLVSCDDDMVLAKSVCNVLAPYQGVQFMSLWVSVCPRLFLFVLCD